MYLNSLVNKIEANLESKTPIPMLNPLNIEMSNLRTSLLPGVLKVTDYNIKHGNSNLRLFETGQIHYLDLLSENKFNENTNLAGIIHGDEKPSSTFEKRKKENILNLKGIIFTLLYKKNLYMNIFFRLGTHPAFISAKMIVINNIEAGFLGQISPKWINELKLDLKRIYGFEINLSPLKKMILNKKEFQKINPSQLFNVI